MPSVSEKRLAAPPAPDPVEVRYALLAWYDRNARSLPWRLGPAERAAGRRPDPYAVWLSEVMLQQTTVAHAGPYHRRFLERWPTVQALAAAADADLMAAWAGLGYYARARNLLACARTVATQHGGVFPQTEAALLALPGVGAYTAAAVAAIAFDQPANAVDANVERVVARLYAVDTLLPQARPELRRLAAQLVGPERAGDWPQALMDLGSGPCRPRAPLCHACPISAECLALAGGDPESYPRKTAKKPKPQRYGAVFVTQRQGAVAVEQREGRGLLGGMLGLPTSAWSDAPLAEPVAGTAVGTVRHVFTHFALELDVRRLVDGVLPEGAAWMDAAEAASALPTVFRKALERALAA